MKRMIVFILYLALISPGHAAEASQSVRFCAMGDVPYSAFEYQLLPLQLEALPTDIEFVVHVGDIKSGKVPCPRSTYAAVSSILKQSPKPLFIIPGDNEWNDCPDPGKAWPLWMEHFDQFEKNWTLPQGLQRDTAQPQNFAFVKNQVLFMGVFVVGGKVGDRAEWKQRHADCANWIRAQLASHQDTVSSAVVFAHARLSKNHNDFSTAFSSAASEFKKPILYLHGDGHRWIEDKPFTAKNIQRIQVDQGRLGPPLLVTATGDPAKPFVFDRRKNEACMPQYYPAAGLTRGPDKGSLVIVGGAGGEFRKNIFKRFLECAGGKNAKIVVVPTSSESAPRQTVEGFLAAHCGDRPFRPAKVTILHTTDPKVADTAAFIAPLADATGVWFTGGRQWRLVDAYGGTKSETAFREVLERGGAIGGSSAGATIQGSFLARGDSKGNTLMIGDHQRGFGYLKNAAIDQHVIARGRQLDLIKLLKDPKDAMDPAFNRHHLLGIGVDENNAVVVQGTHLEVIGNKHGGALVYDPSTWYPGMADRDRFILLGSGSTYDLDTRRVIKFVSSIPPVVKPSKPDAKKKKPAHAK